MNDSWKLQNVYLYYKNSLFLNGVFTEIEYDQVGDTKRGEHGAELKRKFVVTVKKQEVARL